MKKIAAPLVLPGAVALLDPDDAEILDLAAEPINEFEKVLGGRKELLTSLAFDAAPEVRALVVDLLDPHFDKMSLGWLASKCNIGLTDLLRAYRNGVIAKAQIIASQKIAAALPGVVEDVMKRAVPYKEPCQGCDATGMMKVRPTKKVPMPDPAEVTCTICRGKGEVLRLPELDRQRLALEIGELLKSPKGGPTLLQQFNLGTPAATGASDPGAGSLERMQQAVTDILYGRNSNVIDLNPEPSVQETP